MKAMKETTIYLIEDHKLFRESLKSALNEYPEFNVVGDSGKLLEAVEEINKFMPDVIITDVLLPDGDGVQATRWVKQHCPHIEIIVLTIYDSKEIFLQSFEAGARGYLLKGTGLAEIAECIKVVANKGTFLNSNMPLKLPEQNEYEARELS